MQERARHDDLEERSISKEKLGLKVSSMRPILAGFAGAFTAPLRKGVPFIRPYGLEWEASEDVLTKPLPGIKPTMIARAGGLDQGNICLNLADAERRG